MVLIKGGIEEVEVGFAMRWKNMHSVVILTSDVGLKAARENAKTADDIAARVFEDDEPRHPIHLHQGAIGSTIKLDCQHYRCIWSTALSL